MTDDCFTQQVPTFETVESIPTPDPLTEAGTALGIVCGSELFKPVPPLEMLAKGAIVKGSVTLLQGYGDTAKSLIMLDLVLSVAYGVPWLGHFPCERGRAVFLDWENREERLKRRLQRLASWRNLPPGDPNVQLSRMPPRYLNTESVLSNIRIYARSCKLMVLDSLRASTPGLDENDSQNADVLYKLGDIGNATGCTFLVIHHERKAKGGDRPAQLLRGSSALHAAADAVLQVRDGKSGERLLRCVKKRDGISFPEVAFTVADTPEGGLALVPGNSLGMSVQGGVAQGVHVPPVGDRKRSESDIKQQILLYLEQNPGVGNRKLREVVGGKAERVDRIVGVLLKLGVLENRGTANAARYLLKD